MPTYGSVNISKGYYDSGSAKIIMPASTVSLTDLKSGETVGCKNKLFAYSKNNVAGVKITGNANEDITTAHDVSVDLNKPLYLDHTKEYIAGGAEIAPEWSFSNGGTTPNFVTTGSLTFGADGEVSGFSSSNTLKLDRIFKATSTQSFEISFKIKTGSYTGSIQEIFAMSPPLLLRTSSGYWNLPYNTGYWNDSNKDSVSASTVYFVKILYYPTTTTVGGVTYTAKYLYFEVYDSSKTLLHRYDYNLTGTFLNFQNAESYLGSQSGGENWGGSIFLDENAYIKLDGELFWEPYTAIAPGITTQKALVYDNTNDKTFWYPSATSLAMSNFITPADKSNLYYLNLFDIAAQLHVGESAPASGDYMQSSDYVYLNHAHDKILGVQEEPDEIELEATAVTIENYTIVGLPTITDDYVASGFSSSNYIQVEALSSYTDFEYTTVVTPTSTSDQNVIESNNQSSSYSMARIRDGYFGIWGPNQGWRSTGNAPASSGSTYWVKCVYDSSTLKLYVTGYTEGVNPPSNLSNWTLAGEVTDSSDVSGYGSYFTYETFLGFNKGYGEEFHGSIDLKHTSLKVNGVETWRAISQTFTSVQASQNHYWTYLGNTSYDVQGQSMASSSMSGSIGSGYMMLNPNGTLAFTDATSAYQYVGGNTFSGYTILFTDNIHTAISNLSNQSSSKCRVYANLSGMSYVALYVSSLPPTGDIKASIESTDGKFAIAPSGYIPSSSYTYNEANDTISIDGTVSTYIADYYAII